MELTDLAVRFVDALLSSASSDVIGATNWWPRADAALQTAVAGAEEFGHAVTIAASKLQIDVLSPASARAVSDLGASLAAPGVFRAWCEHAARDHVYVIALTRLHRQANSTVKKQPAATAEEAGF